MVYLVKMRSLCVAAEHIGPYKVSPSYIRQKTFVFEMNVNTCWVFFGLASVINRTVYNCVLESQCVTQRQAPV